MNERLWIRNIWRLVTDWHQSTASRRIGETEGDFIEPLLCAQRSVPRIIY